MADWKSIGSSKERLGVRSADEFPPAPGVGFDRRQLLKAAAGALAIAGLQGCQPDERALPYVEAPEFLIPGNPKWYATAVLSCGYAQPVLGKTHVGRPVKLEGNPAHPASNGGTDAFTQAALLGLYEPDRSQVPLHDGQPASFGAVDGTLLDVAMELDRNRGAGFRLLTGTVTSPTLRRQIAELSQRWPQARWHVFEPFDDAHRRDGIELAYGYPLDRHLVLEMAETIVSLDDDFLGPGPHQVRHAAGWSARRAGARSGQGEADLFVAEPTPSLTGIAAGDRLRAGPGQIEALLAALAQAFGLVAEPPPLDGWAAGKAWLRRATDALKAAAGKSLFTLGPHFPPEAHAVAVLINHALGNIGTTLRFSEPVAGRPPDGSQSFEVLCRDMQAGAVSTLLIIDCNPVYTAPMRYRFGDSLGLVRTCIHMGLRRDETASACHWHVPMQHPLESWSDARAMDGTASLIQPLVRPFLRVWSPHVVLDRLLGRDRADHAIVQETWRAAWGEAFEARWRDALAKGFVMDSRLPDQNLPDPKPPVGLPPIQKDGLTVILRPDPTLWDGRFSNNAWLQELPKPLTKVSWSNVIAISPLLARQHKLLAGDEVELSHGGLTVTGAIWTVPGQAENVIVLTAGYGRALPEQLGDGHGYDANRLEFPASGIIIDVTLKPTGQKLMIPTTQTYGAMDGFDFVKTVAAASQTIPPATGAAPRKPAASFYPPQPAGDPAWGMSIDLDACIGCNACIAACVAENNIAMVGPEQVAKGREMFWLRVDRYFEGDEENPAIHFQPVPCMHCEQAPCEMGCPVNATTHSPDGINQQVYNRCIGTRTCSSYCPYKVRHFNWFDFTSQDSPGLQAARNPDVTVRQRGVMEKCTYCVQRISAARIEAKIAGRPIRDGDVKTACQQACPTQAISFGNVADPDSAVSRRKAEPRDYALLEEVNTRPRTTYLAKIRNSREKHA